jgi:mannitol-1-/sugar-/sorbitol-6-phosphatase
MNMTFRYLCTAVLFDLDGVLVHSDASVQRVWREWARRHGLPFQTVMLAAQGRRTVDTIRELAPHLEPRSEAAALEAVQAQDASDVTAGRGAAELISTLREPEWAVVTSGTRVLARARLRAAGLPEPKVLICGDDIARGKPHPDGYLYAAACLGLPAAECIVIEDAAAGVQAARQAGMRVIGLSHGNGGSDLAEADVCVDWCSEIQVERISNGAGAFLLTLPDHPSKGHGADGKTTCG